MENKVLIFIFVLLTLLLSCKKTILKQKNETSSIEISIEKCVILYGSDIIGGFCPNRIHLETTLINQGSDTIPFIVSGERFHEPLLKSQIITILNQDTIRLHPDFWPYYYSKIILLPNDSIDQMLTYNTADYMNTFFAGKRTNFEAALKVDKILIEKLLSQDLVYIINKADYENYALPRGRKIEDFPLPEVYFTKSKDFEIVVDTQAVY